MISFGAKYISSVSAQKVDFKTNAKRPCKVSFVELSPQNKNDVNAVAAASENWGHPECSETILNRMQYMAKCKERKDFNKTKFYAVTANKNDYKTIESSDILGLCRIKTGNEINIDYIQVKPDEVRLSNKMFQYNHIGTAVLNSIKKLFKGKNIQLFSLPDAKSFYLANGFIESAKNSLQMCYKPRNILK